MRRSTKTEEWRRRKTQREEDIRERERGKLENETANTGPKDIIQNHDVLNDQ